MAVPRTLTALPPAVLLTVLAVAGCGSAPAPAAPAPRPTAVAVEDRSRAAAALAVLRTWDRRRASAYASGDAGALAALYTPGSVAGRRDVRTLQGYAGRGLVVRGMRTQLLALEPRVVGEEVVVVRVRDRLVGAVAVHPGRGRRALPTDRPTTRTVTLLRGDDGWRVSSVRPG